MKKVFVSRENYEEVMFNLVENEYPTEVQNDILDQIKTDVFLSFEWEQWKKSHYTESIEKYRFENIEFIESLVKKEPGRFLFYSKRVGIAAGILLIFSMYFLLREKQNINNEVVKRENTKQGEKAGKEIKPEISQQQTVNNKKSITAILKKEGDFDSNNIVEYTLDSQKRLPVISPTHNITKTIDSIREVYVNAVPAKKPKYNISIQTDEVSGNDIKYVNLEKRYTIKDLENKKDGITIQKFLMGSKSRIVNNVATNTRVLELYTSDNYILEINLLK